MEGWIRDNTDRLALATIGLAAVVIGIVFHEQQFLSACVSILGIGVLVLAVLLRRVPAFSVGPKSVEARLDLVESGLESIEEKVEQAVIGDVAPTGSLGEPVVIPDAPSHWTKSGAEDGGQGP